MDRLDARAFAWLAATGDANTAALLAGTRVLPQGDRESWTNLEALAVSLRANGADARNQCSTPRSNQRFGRWSLKGRG